MGRGQGKRRQDGRLTVAKDGRVYGGTPVQRFWRLAGATRSLGCWLWEGSLNGYGYGRLVVGDERVRAHRFAWETFVGPIPEGMTIDHLCLNKRCVNPAHLEVVTSAENTRRAGPLTRLRHETCRGGHAWTPENTYTRSSGRRQCRACMNEYVEKYRQRRRLAAKQEVLPFL
jgi:hypothetical protein